jgi:hypothetical protein
MADAGSHTPTASGMKRKAGSYYTASSKTSRSGPNPKQPAPKQVQQDPLIGKRVKSMDTKGKITGKGTIVRAIKKGKGCRKWEVEWEAKYNYSNGKYTKRDIDLMLL